MNERDIFIAALQHENPIERQEYLVAACEADAALLKRVQDLLEVHERAGQFLERPAQDLGSTLERPSPARSGDVIGPYKLLQQIGEGGMGTVYVAQQTRPVERKVALKIIKPGMDSREVIARFEAERQALALMDHPNIARVLDAGATPDGRPYFVMELVKGMPFTRYCDEHHLTPRERLQLFVPVCQAVQHAHQKGIIHRDLKPSNVLVAQYDGQPVPKVIDFGVAKATSRKLTDLTMYTEIGQIVGTLEYMSPEQAEMNQLDIDTRSDIYSLGVMLYELLTGSTPLERKKLRSAAFDEMLRQIREVEPPKPSTRLSTTDGLPGIAANRGLEPKKLSGLVRGELDWIVMKALEKDRRRRYETANDVAQDLQRYLQDEPVQAGPPSATYRMRKFLRRHKRPVAAAALVLLALVAGVVGTTWGMVRARQAWREEAKRADSEFRAKTEAQQQVAITQAVNEFVQQDLLGQADVAQQPDSPQGRDRDIKVRTLLDRAAQSLDTRFAQAPVTEAAIRLTIGNAYMALGEFDVARVHLERSHRLRIAEVGPDHADTLGSQVSLAELHLRLGDPPTARTLLVNALAKYQALHGTDHPAVLHCKHRLARAYMATDLDGAEALLLEVVGAPHTSRTTLLGAQQDLAVYHFRRGNFENASALLEELVPQCVLAWGVDHPRVLVVQELLASIYVRSERPDKAEPLLEHVLECVSTLRGTDHPDTLRTKDELAFLYLHQGKLERAEPLLQEVVEGNIAKLGPNHGLTLRSQNNLAKLHLDQGELNRAKEILEPLLETQLPPEHPEMLKSKHMLGVVAMHLGNFEKAQTLLTQVLAARTARLEADHPEVIRNKHTLARLYFQQEQYERAMPPLQECLAILESKEPGSLITAECQTLLGGCLTRLQKYSEAEPLLLRAHQTLERPAAQLAGPRGRSAHAIMRTLEFLVNLYDEWDRPEESAHWRKELESRPRPERMRRPPPGGPG